MASSERGQNAAKQPTGHWAARLSAVLPRLCSPFQSLPCSVPRHTAHGTRFLPRWDQAALFEGACPCVLPGAESLVRKDGPFPGLTQALGGGKPRSA